MLCGKRSPYCTNTFVPPVFLMLRRNTIQSYDGTCCEYDDDACSSKDPEKEKDDSKDDDGKNRNRHLGRCSFALHFSK